jgi:hypothetical protein
MRGRFYQKTREWCEMFCRNRYVDIHMTSWDELEDDDFADLIIVAYWHKDAKAWTIYGFLSDAFIEYAIVDSIQQEDNDLIRCYAPMMAGHGIFFEKRDSFQDFLLYVQEEESPQLPPTVRINRYMWYNATTDCYTPTRTPDAPHAYRVKDNRILSLYGDENITPIVGKLCRDNGGGGWTKAQIRKHIKVDDKQLSRQELCNKLRMYEAQASNDAQHFISYDRNSSV